MASLTPQPVYADTHVIAWLFAGRLELLSAVARSVVRDHPLLVSPMVVVELEYLFEIGRTSEPARTVVEALGREVGLEICDLPFPKVALQAVEQAWTRDPFDRFITGQALLRGAPLLSKDAEIRRHCRLAFWDEPLPLEPSHAASAR